MIILGGGPLGLEFSQIYNRFGAKVAVLQSTDRIADREEPELADFLQKKLEAEGIVIHTSAKTKSVSRHDGLIEIQADVKGKEIILKAEKLLVATGVRANTQSLNLDGIGVRVGEKGGVITNDYLQSDLPHIFAAGMTASVRGAGRLPRFWGRATFGTMILLVDFSVMLGIDRFGLVCYVKDIRW